MATVAIGEWNNVQILEPNHPRAKSSINRLRRNMEAQSQSLQQAARRLRIVNLYNNALQSFDQGNYATAMANPAQRSK